MKLKDHLWTIASNSPRSSRFFQISFDGFRPRGKNKIEQGLNTVKEFLNFFVKYIRYKGRKSLLFLHKSLLLSLKSYSLLKSFVVTKLIWSRGRLGRPVATTIVMGAAFTVFMFGKVFNTSQFVVSKEVSPDYLASVSDIIPQRNIAVTTIPDSRKAAEPFTYVVKSGDTVSSIGSEFRISADAIKYVNGLSDWSVLAVGQEIVIPPVTGLIHTVESGDSLNSIARKYDVAPQAIADFNYILDTSSLALGTELVIPDAKVPQPTFAPVTTPAVVTAGQGQQAIAANRGNQGFCVWPTPTRIVTQYFSWYHNGVDVATPFGRAMPPLFACREGRVTRAGWDPFGLGLHVRIDHGNGYQTLYGHMSRVDVGFGEQVRRGQVIGTMGNTGRSTGPHVHFMVLYNGVAQDPLQFTQ